MSERRRRKAKDEESDSESEASGENQHSDSESETGESANDEDETSPPNYEEAVKLESVITDSTAVGSKKTGSKTRGTESAPKKDPAFVPRSDRFFLHDNREGSGNGKTGSTGTGRNMRKSEPSSREPERTDRRRPAKEINTWKHDKYEEIVLKEPANAGKSSSQPRRTKDRSGSKSSSEPVIHARPKAAISGPPAEDLAAVPDPVQVYLRNTERNARKVPAPNYSTSKPDGQVNQGKSQDTRQSYPTRGPPPHSLDSVSHNVNRQVREQHNAPVSHGVIESKKITYSHTAPTPPGTVEKKKQQQYGLNSEEYQQRGYQGGHASYGHDDRGVSQSHQLAQHTPIFVPTQHAQAFVPQSAERPMRVEQTVRMTPISAPTTPMKPPPGLDTSLNPSAREFQPTDDSPTPSSASHHNSSRKLVQEQRRYEGPGGYDYAPPIVRPTGQNGAYHEAPKAAPIVQQVTFRGGAPVPAHPVHQSSAGAAAPYAPSPRHSGANSPGPSEYRPRRDGNNNRSIVSPSHSEADLYAQGHGHTMPMNMIYRGAAPTNAGYSMPMNMPVYDPQMVYMDPSMNMGMMGGRGMAQYMNDGTVWYANVPSQGMGMPVPVAAEGSALGGGTVYYPLPPNPTGSE